MEDSARFIKYRGQSSAPESVSHEVTHQRIEWGSLECGRLSVMGTSALGRPVQWTWIVSCDILLTDLISFGSSPRDISWDAHREICQDGKGTDTTFHGSMQ